MDTSYQDPEIGLKYLEFLRSPDGKQQQELLWEYLSSSLPREKNLEILDAGCGNGWLAKKLSDAGGKVFGCDISNALIQEAKINCPGGEFVAIDICKEKPFAENSFNIAILNMVAHDLENQKNAFENLRAMLKPKGLLFLTIINPYYAFPVGQWKRGLLFFKKPKLFLKAYNFLARKNRKFFWEKNIPGLFYTLPETINTALKSGFNLTRLDELNAKQDSQNFDFNYRLYRFPIILLLQFEKASQQ